MTENKRFGYGADVNWQGDIIIDYETEKSYDFYEVGKLLNELNRLADGNEEQLLKVMSYLHDKHYDIWEEVNKECFNDRE